MIFVENIVPHLARYLEEGRQVALATLINVEGSSPRPIGSQIGVADDGRCVGMITGGCAEKAIVAEALTCLKHRENRLVRYGAGSPYLDVVLPCGSGLDIHFETRNAEAIVRSVHKSLDARTHATFLINVATKNATISGNLAVGPEAGFRKIFEPDYQVFAFGEGPNLVSFCDAATAAGLLAKAYSPDQETCDFLNKNNQLCEYIHLRSNFSEIPIDRYSGLVTLFHEHEWEAPILHAALNSNAAYIGALGSRRTHKARLEAIGAMGPTRQAADKIHGPVGLDIGAKTPSEIAIAIVAEIIEHRRAERPGLAL